MEIGEVKAKDTWKLRRDVMWPGKSISFVQLPQDEAGRHFAVFEGGTMVSVVSLFVDGGKAQFRKLATLPSHQRKGYATALLHHLLLKARAQGISELWCNARYEKAGFYRRLGFAETGASFTKDGKSYVVMACNVAVGLLHFTEGV